MRGRGGRDSTVRPGGLRPGPIEIGAELLSSLSLCLGKDSDDEALSGHETVDSVPHEMSELPAYPIADHRISNSLGHDEADRGGSLVGCVCFVR